VMPKLMFDNGKMLRAGIVGDYMIDSEYRVFGPALALQKKVIESLETNKLDYIYTIPNSASIQISKRSGLRKVLDLRYYVKPISTKYYLRKYLNNLLADFLGPIINAILRVLSRESYITKGGYIQEISEINRSFDIFWENIKSTNKCVIGNHSSKYLRWRYFENPLVKIKVIAYKEVPNSEILAYIAFAIADDRLEIFDIVGLGDIYIDRLMKEIVKIARTEKVISICMRLSEQNYLPNKIKKYGFYKTMGDVCVLAYGKDDSFFVNWCYVEGDRNI